SDRFPEVDFYGIDLATEYEVRDQASRVTKGRPLSPDDKLACIIDTGAVEDLKVSVGDVLLAFADAARPPYEVEIVGLYERRRLQRYQKPVAFMNLSVLQEITNKQHLITTTEIVLKQSDRPALITAANHIRNEVRKMSTSATIRSAEARMKQIEAAQDQQSFVLVLLSSVALLTALFIILSTLSMGMIERIHQLGLLRCIGVTRMQLAGLVMLEVLPLGLAGILLGVPVGVGLTALTVWLVPEYVGGFAVSWSGISQAVVAGLATTFVAGFLPALAALRVSPMEAARPRARSPRSVWLVAVAGLAGVILAVQWAVTREVTRSMWFVQFGSVAVALLYFGYAFLAPLCVRLVGAPAVALAARLIQVRTRLLQDQVGYAVWRSAGICCGLMVGLSLIVAIFVVNESVTRGWQFPKQFPEAYVWSPEMIRGKNVRTTVAPLPGVKTVATAAAINVSVEEKPGLLSAAQISQTWFMGCDTDEFLDTIKVEFLDGEGDEKSAREKLREGGYVLIADDFSRSRNKHLGDTIRIFAGSTPMRTFRVAGVIKSPAIDIAANYFQAHMEYNVVAAGSVMGSMADLKAKFYVDGVSLVLVNFDLPDQPPPAGWPPPETDAVWKGLPRQAFFQDRAVPVATRWRRFREEKVLRSIREALDVPQANSGTVRELKDEIDAELTNMTRLMTAVPSVALLVAAIGVANLMTANVTARSRQIAIMRAVGATRGLILRMVIGEAVVLGILGSGLGLALGVHLAETITALVERMWGFAIVVQLPWLYLIVTIVLTVALCIVAGVIPARHASRTNIVDALRVG
ncbi:MAG: FtsX-like permease family protein, partial [Planctomycetes bacterium]|nr:FtsX-like permease family protein [Planctomycetota bacterium]